MKTNIPEPKYIKVYKKDIRAKFNLTIDPDKFYDPDDDIKTKQCFCQSIYNGETNQVENCTCGKCADSLKKQESDWEYKIEPILVRNFDNDKYQWTRADKELKDFISQLLKDQREELKKKVLVLAEDHYWDSFAQDKSSVLKHLKFIVSLL